MFRFADIGGWAVLCNWFEEAVEQKFYAFAAEIIKLFFELPIISKLPEKSTVSLIQKLSSPDATIPICKCVKLVNKFCGVIDGCD